MTDDVTYLRLGSIPGITVTYGVVEPGGYARGGVPMLQAQNILRGRLASDSTMRIDEAVHLQNRRTWLRQGDLVVVLVGRVGDAALVTAEHAGWNAARSVGVIRCTDSSDQATSTVEWLRYWFKSPSMRLWFAREARGFAQPTIGARAIANLTVPLPAAADRHRCLDVLAQVEERALASLDLSRAATDTADALFAQLRMAGGALPALIGDVCEARAGGGRAHRRTVVDEADTDESGRSGVQVATADVLNAEFPYWWNRMTGGPDRAWTEPGQLLIATKKGASRIVLDASGDAEAARGTLSVRADGAEEQWWLLHELRARRGDIALAAQGASARELSARAFSSLPLAWPTARVRSEFAELASALHQRAILALEDHDDMQRMVGLLIERALRVSPAPEEGQSR
ncbi:restriction endonuclease subunit S domain-containing protein [Actinacidiphila alni]|nr:hypothetical protein [Actinacidiphila alni]